MCGAILINQPKDTKSAPVMIAGAPPGCIAEMQQTKKQAPKPSGNMKAGLDRWADYRPGIREKSI